MLILTQKQDINVKANKKCQAVVLLLFQEFSHQCCLWHIMPHHWSPSVFWVLSLLLILHCWLLISWKLFHVTCILPWPLSFWWASTSSELYPNYFLLLPFAKSLFLQVLQIWGLFLTYFAILIYIRIIRIIEIISKFFLFIINKLIYLFSYLHSSTNTFR